MTTEQKDLERMMEDFLSDNHVEDNQFSENVIASLPQQPRLVWITHLYPVMGILAGLLAAWKFDAINPQTAMVWVSKLSVLWNTHVGVSATLSLSVVAGLAAVCAFFFTEKIKNW